MSNKRGNKENSEWHVSQDEWRALNRRQQELIQLQHVYSRPAHWHTGPTSQPQPQAELGVIQTDQRYPSGPPQHLPYPHRMGHGPPSALAMHGPMLPAMPPHAYSYPMPMFPPLGPAFEHTAASEPAVSTMARTRPPSGSLRATGKARANAEVRDGVFEFCVAAVNSKSRREWQTTTDVQWEPFLAKAVDMLETTAHTIKLAYKINGETGAPTVLDSAQDWQQAMAKVSGKLPKGGKRKQGDQDSGKAKKISREDTSLTAEYKRLEAHLRCERHQASCFVNPAGEHIQCDYADLSYWARKIQSNQASISRPPEKLNLEQVVKPRGRTGPGSRGPPTAFHFHINQASASHPVIPSAHSECDHEPQSPALPAHNSHDIKPLIDIKSKLTTTADTAQTAGPALSLTPLEMTTWPMLDYPGIELLLSALDHERPNDGFIQLYTDLHRAGLTTLEDFTLMSERCTRIECGHISIEHIKAIYSRAAEMLTDFHDANADTIKSAERMLAGPSSGALKGLSGHDSSNGKGKETAITVDSDSDVESHEDEGQVEVSDNDFDTLVGELETVDDEASVLED